MATLQRGALAATVYYI